VGTSRSFAEFDRKLLRLQGEYRDLPLSVVKESSLIVKMAILAATKPASGGDLRLSGVRGRGAVGARYTVVGAGDEAKSLIYATGPFHLIERNTKAGVRARKRRGGRGKNRMIGPISGYYHPGTSGKHPFALGVEASAPLVKRLFEARHNLALRRIF
jgi:hypothetical protein